MSLNVQTVVLDLEKHKFLGISIVGQNNETGDGGIYIGSIMKGGAVAADGRIEAGDMLLQGKLTHLYHQHYHFLISTPSAIFVAYLRLLNLNYLPEYSN